MSLLNAKRYPLNVSSGFTLIELLVVIAIIGILSSVVLASLNSARVKARDARRVGDLKQIQVALELYYDAKSEYPVAVVDMVGSSGGKSLPSEPKDPQGDTIYPYLRKADKTGYHLGANLEQAAGDTTLDQGDRDLDPGEASWTTLNGEDGTGKKCDNATTWTGFCYDVSNL